MAKEKRVDHITRSTIMGLLSGDETARVSNAEAAAALGVGDEFIDLAKIDKGVQFAGEAQPADGVLPRKALHESTWNKIVKRLHDA